MTETGSDDDESEKDDNKSESEAGKEESVSRLQCKLRDLAELGGEELQQTSFNNAHNKP